MFWEYQWFLKEPYIYLDSDLLQGTMEDSRQRPPIVPCQCLRLLFKGLTSCLTAHSTEFPKRDSLFFSFAHSCHPICSSALTSTVMPLWLLCNESGMYLREHLGACVSLLIPPKASHTHTQVSRGSAGEYQADERADVARLTYRVSGRWAGRCRVAQVARIRQMILL